MALRNNAYLIDNLVNYRCNSNPSIALLCAYVTKPLVFYMLPGFFTIALGEQEVVANFS